MIHTYQVSIQNKSFWLHLPDSYVTILRYFYNGATMSHGNQYTGRVKQNNIEQQHSFQ